MLKTIQECGSDVLEMSCCHFISDIPIFSSQLVKELRIHESDWHDPLGVVGMVYTCIYSLYIYCVFVCSSTHKKKIIMADFYFWMAA